LLELACVNVALPDALAEICIPFKAVLPLAVMGINKIIELPPHRASVNVVDVADAFKVKEPVEFNLPSIVLFKA
jgi:hypothetical protein